MRYLILMVFALFATGCTSLQNAGTASYHVKPFLDAAGNAICCEVAVENGKEIALLKAHIAKAGDSYTVDLEEQGVAAFQGQQIAAGALKTAVDGAVKAAIAAALIPALPALAPVAGAALASPGAAAAALGAAGVLGTQQLLAPSQALVAPMSPPPAQPTTTPRAAMPTAAELAAMPVGTKITIPPATP